ncbi:MAG: end-binding protein Ku [Thermoleophilia bacterium]|nr:end-binding protein Ku [Thermoleophilia bacterium]
MPRAIWSGSITFGLISLPVKAYTAARRENISFDLLHDEDHAHIEYKRICPVHHEEVPWEHIIKGYEIEPGKYVTFTKQELEELQPEATHSIDIEDFVPLEEIDPMYFDTPYHLAAAPGAKRAYDLLRAVMVDAQVVAIARVVIRTRERLVAIRPLPGGTLSMETLHYADELRELPEDAGDARKSTPPSEREVEMARALVDELTVEFDPTKYKDTWRDDVLARIEEKAAGKTISAPDTPQPEATPTSDIMKALEASLAAARAKRGEPVKAAASTKRTTKSATAAKQPAAKKPAVSKPASTKPAAKKTAKAAPATKPKAAAKKAKR